MSARKFRNDLARLQPVERLPDGRVRVQAHLTRAGIFEYRNPDGTVRRELRPAEEVFRPESMRSFAVVPFTDDHPPDMLTAANASQYAKGSTGDTIVRDDDHIRCMIGVFDEATIRKMDAGKLELSGGYTCDVDETPGTHPLWGAYDAVQRNIVGNHVALVDKGRAGTATVRMDSAFMVQAKTDADWDEGAHPRGEGGKFGAGGGGSPHAASASAFGASAKAEAVGSREAHTAAAHLHQEAASAHQGTALAKMHSEQAAQHLEVAHSAPAAASMTQPVDHSEKATQATAVAYRAPEAEHRTANLTAAKMHAIAAAAHDEAGNTIAAAEHQHMAESHGHAAASAMQLRIRPGPMTAPGTYREQPRTPGGPARAMPEKPPVSAKAAAATEKARNASNKSGVAAFHAYSAGATPAKVEKAKELLTKSAEAHEKAAEEHRKSGSANDADYHAGIAAQDREKAKDPTVSPYDRPAKDPWGATAHPAVGQAASHPAVGQGAKLGPRERAVLHAIATSKAGESDKKVLKIAGMTLHEAHTHIQNARAVLGIPDTKDTRSYAVALHKAGELTGRKDDAILGAVLASAHTHGTVDAMHRRDISEPSPDPDPDDLASRNERDPERDDGDPDDNEPEMDSAVSLYDADGRLTDEAAGKIAAASFALPGKQRLPIHDPASCKQSMRDFGTAEYDSADEKHGAFNRLISKATQFGIGTTKFARAHAGTLDKKDSQDMIDAETRLAAEKSKKRAKQRDEARTRADKAETDLAAAQGQIASLTADLAAEKAKNGSRNDAAETEFAAKVASKVELVVAATTIVGVGKVDAKMSDRDIKVAVIKHVDKTDVPADKHPAYVDALYDGAVSRARADAVSVAAGGNALAAARAAGAAPQLPVTGTQPAPRADADEDDEVAAATRMRTRSAGLASQPGRMTKDSVLAANGAK